MTCLVALSNGTEPTRHVPELISAHRYLGLSDLLCYTDPLYDDIVDRKNGGADENIIVLHKILRADRVSLYQYLVQRGATVTLDDLLMATRANAVGIVKFILETALDQQIHGSRCLMLAARDGAIEVVRYLLQHVYVDPTLNTDYALLWAATKGHVDIVKLLLADPRVAQYKDLHRNFSNRSKYPVMKAALNGHLEVVRLLMADPRTTFRPAEDELPYRYRNCDVLIEAAIGGDIDVVRFLINYTPPLGTPDVDLTFHIRYALYEARERNHIEIVSLLEEMSQD